MQIAPILLDNLIECTRIIIEIGVHMAKGISIGSGAAIAPAGTAIGFYCGAFHLRRRLDEMRVVSCRAGAESQFSKKMGFCIWF